MTYMSTECPSPTKVGIKRWQHEASGRPTYVTYSALVAMSDGTRVPCGHEGHRSFDAAVTCGRKLFKRLTKTAAR